MVPYRLKAYTSTQLSESCRPSLLLVSSPTSPLVTAPLLNSLALARSTLTWLQESLWTLTAAGIESNLLAPLRKEEYWLNSNHNFRLEDILIPIKAHLENFEARAKSTCKRIDIIIYMAEGRQLVLNGRPGDTGELDCCYPLRGTSLFVLLQPLTTHAQVRKQIKVLWLLKKINIGTCTSFFFFFFGSWMEKSMNRIVNQIYKEKKRL